MDRKHFCEAFPTPATDSNHNPIHTFGKRTIDKLKGRTPSLPIEMNEEVIRAACYMKMLLKVCTSTPSLGNRLYWKGQTTP